MDLPLQNFVLCLILSPVPVPVVEVGDKLAVIAGEPCELATAVGYVVYGCCETVKFVPVDRPVNELPEVSAHIQTLPAKGKFDDVKKLSSEKLSELNHCILKK